MNESIDLAFSSEELRSIRSRFYGLTQDFDGTPRLFFDNAGGSLRLKAAEERFHLIDRLPDCSEHSNRTAEYLSEIESAGKNDLLNNVFHAETGVLFPGYTASQLMMEAVRVISENARGTNYVTTILEHPSAYDAVKYYAQVHNCEMRVAGVNKESGGVDSETVLNLIDENTALLSCMAASNISGYIYDLESIFQKARQINPDIFILCDAVQHAPHGVLDVSSLNVDFMNIAPYKFFGVRGFGVAYISERASTLMHHRLLEKRSDEWSLGSPAPAHFAAATEIVNYVAALGAPLCSAGASRRLLYEAGMQRIASHERLLLSAALEGTGQTEGLRHMKGVTVKMDGAPLEQRDFIIGVEFDALSCEQAVLEYEKRGVVTFERSVKSLYSRRMVQAFDSCGMVRVSPLHIHTVQEIEHFLKVTRELTALI